ncbi:MAG: ABC transporter permease [Elusimicrobia bacterium]|nr:ABC transporter permease [Elusimicrobiota bacterium]
MEAKKPPLIEIKNITKSYDLGGATLEILKGITLTVEEGDFVAVMGPSGSGKSTLMHILGLFDRPSGGEYHIYGQDILSFNDEQTAFLRSKMIGFVFQQYNLLARLTSLENVMLPLIYSNGSDRADKAKELLGSVGLAERLNHHPNQLSGGQQQRVAIARALVNSPKIIFADEPTGNLSSSQAQEIMQILKDLNKKGISIILVTHEPAVAEWAARNIMIKDGQIISDVRKTPLAAADKEIPQIKKTKAGLSLAEIKENFLSAAKFVLINKARSFLTMLGIIIGVGSIIAMLAIGRGAQDSMAQRIKSLGADVVYIMPGLIQINGVSSNTPRKMTIEDAYALKANTDLVDKVDPMVSGSFLAEHNGKNTLTTITGASTAYEELQNATPVYGRFFTNKENDNMSKVCVLGQTVVNNIFGQENPIGQYVRIAGKRFLVVGVLPVKGATGFRDADDIIVVPVNTALKRLTGGIYISSAAIKVKNNKILEAEKFALLTMLSRYRLPVSQVDSFRTRNMADLVTMLETTTSTMTILLGVVACISLLVGGIGIMNIMLVSVSERTAEIGLRKAVGATKNSVLLQFLIEASGLSLTGGILGIIFGVIVSLAVSKVTGWTITVTVFSILLSVGFSAGVGVIFGFLPARKASQLSPIEALRYE